MASKFGFAGGIPERRVRPIWDAIDSRQFKNALKLTTALLSKYSTSPYALALKALVLERMGKNEEALSVCLNAKEILFKNDSNVLVDDLTLSTLQIVFQRLDHLEMATSCYEYACGKYANNLELMMGLFNCYVREYSFVKQQQIAIKMYKIAGEERFLLWAVCSIQLQVCCGNGGHNLFVLAEGLLKKHIASHSLHEPEALSVYMSLLEQQSKFRDALEILSGDLGALMGIEADKLRLQGRLLARAGDYAAAADVFKKVLELCPDDWECFLQYIGCLLEDGDSLTQVTNYIHPPKLTEFKNLQLEEEVFDARISDAVNFINKVMQEPQNESLRSPYLGHLEIERQKLLRGKGDAGKVVEGLVQYFMRFGHLASFTSDVEIFLEVLDKDKKGDLLKNLVKQCEASTNGTTKALGRSLTVFKIQNFTGNLFSLQVNELEDLAVRMTELFCKNLALSKELDSQESLYGEELLSMACHVLVQLFWRTRDVGYLLESIMILEFGLTLRRFVWQYKILLVHLYSYWSCLPLAYELYKSLDVKNILLESMSHHILPQMLASPLLPDSNHLLSEYLKFMDDHFRESADLTFVAYRHRNYSKVVEFVQFKEKLQRSGQYLMAKIEGPLLQLKQNANSVDEEESLLESLGQGTHFVELSNEIRSKKLTFNEDLTLRPWWTPTYDKNYLLGPFEEVSYTPRGKTHNETSPLEATVLTTIEKRSLLPRMICLSMQSASGSVKENLESNGTVVDPKLSVELKNLLERYSKILEFPFQDAIELLVGVSRGQNPTAASSMDVVDWMNFAVFLNAWNLRSHEIKLPDKENAGGSGTWHIVNSLIKKYVLEKINSAGPILSSPGTDLSILVQLVTEPLAWHSLILQSCVRTLVPSGKKKKKGGADHSNSQVSREILGSIQSLCDTIEMVANWLREQIRKPDDEKLNILYSPIQGDGETNGPGKVFKVLESSVSQYKDIELGERLNDGLRGWNPADVPRKIIKGQTSLLTEFLKICESKIKSLQSIRHLL